MDEVTSDMTFVTSGGQPPVPYFVYISFAACCEYADEELMVMAHSEEEAIQIASQHTVVQTPRKVWAYEMDKRADGVYRIDVYVGEK